MNLSWDDVDELHEALEILSLDLAEPAFADLRINADKAEHVRGIARRFVTEWENATPEDPYSRYDPVWPPIVAAALERLTVEVGADVAAQVIEFARADHHSGDAWIWESLLREIGLASRFPPLPFDEVTNERIATLVVTRLRDAERASRLASLGAGPDTEWDATRRQTFWINAGDPPDSDPDADHPLAGFIDTAVSTRETREVLETIGAELDDSQRGKLVAWARSQAKAMDYPVKLVTAPDWAWS